MLAFRFSMNSFSDSIETMVVFKNQKDLFLFLCKKYHCSMDSFRIQPYCFSRDSRCSWNHTNLVLYLRKNSWYTIGYCCDDFDLNGGVDIA